MKQSKILNSQKVTFKKFREIVYQSCFLFELKKCFLCKPNKADRPLNILHAFESLAKPKVSIQQSIKKMGRRNVKEVTFIDSGKVDFEAEEK